MMGLKGIFLASFFVIASAGCTQPQPANIQDSSIQQNKQETQARGTQSNQGAFSDVSSLCEKVKQLHEANGIQNIVITKSNSKEDQHIDINNDNIPDKIGYMPTRSYMALVDIRDGRKIGFPTENPTALYTGADIVQIDGKNYVLHYAQSEPYELTEVTNSLPKNASLPYHLNTLCKFYEYG